MADHAGTREESSEIEPRQDPRWPQVDGGHPVTELMAPTQGSLSPYGETPFPLPADQLDYEHPVTEINR